MPSTTKMDTVANEKRNRYQRTRNQRKSNRTTEIIGLIIDVNGDQYRQYHSNISELHIGINNIYHRYRKHNTGQRKSTIRITQSKSTSENTKTKTLIDIPRYRHLSELNSERHTYLPHRRTTINTSNHYSYHPKTYAKTLSLSNLTSL